MSYRGKRSIDYPAQGKPYNIFFPPLERRIFGTYRLTGLRIRSYVPTQTSIQIVETQEDTYNKTHHPQTFIYFTSREVNEARRPHTCSRPYAFEVEEKKTEKKQTRQNPPHPKHTTKSTAARRPRPPRDGARRNTSHALAHTCPLP